MIDADVVRRMLSLAAIRPNERVLEVGTGKGIITTELLKITKDLEAIEIDVENYLETKNRVDSDFALRLGDAFETQPSFDVLVSSLPYSESSRFVEWLSQLTYKRAIILAQEDFAEKITAKAGSPSYRAVSVIAQIAADLRLDAAVPPEAFEPPPRVNSRLMVFTAKRKLALREIKTIKVLFSLRRRRLATTLNKFGFNSPRLGYSGLRRLNSLTPQEVYDLVHSVHGTM